MFARLFEFMRPSKEEMIKHLEDQGLNKEADIMAGRVLEATYSIDLKCFTTMETYISTQGYITGDQIGHRSFSEQVAESELVGFYNKLEEIAFDIERRQREKVKRNPAKWAPYTMTIDITLSGKLNGQDVNKKFDDLALFKTYLKREGFVFDTFALLQNTDKSEVPKLSYEKI